MSRANVENRVFLASFAARILAIGVMVRWSFKLVRSMAQEVAYERAWKYPGDR